MNIINPIVKIAKTPTGVNKLTKMTLITTIKKITPISLFINVYYHILLERINRWLL